MNLEGRVGILNVANASGIYLRIHLKVENKEGALAWCKTLAFEQRKAQSSL